MFYLVHNSREFDEAWRKVQAGDEIRIVVDANPSYRFYFNTIQWNEQEASTGECCCS